jgi:histone-lysine N-methyltransferase SETD3
MSSCKSHVCSSDTHAHAIGPFFSKVQNDNKNTLELDTDSLDLLVGLVGTDLVSCEEENLADINDHTLRKRKGWYRLFDAISLSYSGDGKGKFPSKVLIAARVFCLSKEELYFLDDPSELKQALNHRNEAAAVSLIHQRLHEGAFSLDQSIVEAFYRDLNSYCVSLWSLFQDAQQNHDGITADASQQNRFLSWSNQKRIMADKLALAEFDGIRGCMAKENVCVGDDILAIPQEVLIYEDTVLKTDLGKMLSVIPGLGMDNLLIIFTMIDRWQEDSEWKPFWDELPDEFRTGITFPESIVDLLYGSSAYDEVKKAQKHIQDQYNACAPLFEVLVAAYPTYLTSDMFTYTRYAWAVELWYSYAFEIEFPPSPKSKTVMVPFACLVNHSPWPHVVRYGKMDVNTRSLRYPAFRPCSKGKQVFISYGPVPNVKLITYYGFVIPGNPHDIVPLTFETQGSAEMDIHGKIMQALNQTGLTLDHNIRYGPIPLKLKACLRILVADSKELDSILSGACNPLTMVNEDNERQAMTTLHSALEDVLKPLERALDQCKDLHLESSWKPSALFCQEYLQNQCRIIEKNLGNTREFCKKIN